MRVYEALSQLAKRQSELTNTATLIAELCREVDRIPLDTFFEPISLISIEKGQHRLFPIDTRHLTAWTRHMSSSTRCRMRVLEEPILGNIVAGRTLAAMVLLRSHLESAALAAYSLDRLTEAAQNNKSDLLQDLIAQTLFGTALKKHREKDPVAELLKMHEGSTIKICSAVDSLDKFYCGESAVGEFSILYSLLCDFAHPNHRGVMDFMQSVERADGWLISYSEQEPLNPTIQQHALEHLLASMRGGYSASEMLRCWGFSQSRDGLVEWHFPSSEDGARIWSRLLQRTSGKG